MTKDTRDVEADERHPFRFMIKLAVFFGILYAAGRFVAEKKGEYAGLTETQARDKLMEKMSPKIGEDTAGDIADQVIPKLRDRGIIKADPTEVAVDEVVEAVDEKIDEGSDKVTEAVDSVVKD